MVSAADVLARARSPQGQKAIRYTLVSAISVVIGQALLALFYNVAHWSAAWSVAQISGTCFRPTRMLPRRPADRNLALSGWPRS